MTSAQIAEFNSSYAHVSGNGGIDGFNLGTAWWPSHRLAIAFDYDDGWDTGHVGVFDLTQGGTVISKNHLQSFLVGPRIYFGTLRTKQKYLARFLPFAETQIGASHLSSKIENPVTNVTQSASDNAFSWMIGGGGDYRFSPHWATRVKVDFLRTHFVDTGQGHLRFAIGIMYSLGNGIAAQQAAADKRKADEQRAAEAETNAIKEQAEKDAQARKQSLAEQAERERAAAEAATLAKQKADVEYAGAEARKKVVEEQLAARQASEATVQKAPEAKPSTEVEQAATQARKEAMDQHESEKQALRARLLANFNRVLPTTDTPRGLVVDMGDIMFDTGQSDLRPQGREVLAKLSGIVLNYPSLRLKIEGHTDNAGSAEFNQALSEHRASTVRDYLVGQGLDASSVSAQGLGAQNPVSDNVTSQGREKNRRVEIILSGEVIGTPVGEGQ
jgi:outer membrane protein OmpA-like peptidoglycan-associated protein/opacity protein-like surface antigen